MMGVVLWSDAKDCKAVFWCEDHGELAYYNASTEAQFKRDQFGPGDMVEFDVSLENKVRRAHNARIVEAKVCNGLQDNLRNTAGQSYEPANRLHSANVVDMVPRQARR